ncbi:hypothetical protein oki361_07760 [Helicobacter pylori]
MAKQKQNNELEKMLINPKYECFKIQESNDIECIKKVPIKTKAYMITTINLEAMSARVICLKVAGDSA